MTESAALIRQSLVEHKDLLWKVNQKIFSNPELALEEFIAHDTLVAALQSQNSAIRVTPHAYGLQTAFEAEFGSAGRVLTFNAEYDALPDIGHACGHNLIATTSLGAFLSVVDALKTNKKPGRVRLLGTPAEEAIGGKIKLIAAGAYKGVDACMMMHPTSASHWPSSILGDAFDKTLAIIGFKATFRGKAAHAAISPWNGVNALDAAVLAYTSIATLRQQVRPDERIHGIITEGGVATNIIPEKAVLEYDVRAPTAVGAAVLGQRIVACFRGAAEATGCELEVEDMGGYKDLRVSLAICQAFQEAIRGMGLEVENNVSRDPTPASTDQGDVSYECPSWHGVFGIPSEGAYPHTAGFEKGARTEAAFERALVACEGMAVAGYRFLVDDGLATEVKSGFQTQQIVS